VGEEGAPTAIETEAEMDSQTKQTDTIPDGAADRLTEAARLRAEDARWDAEAEIAEMKRLASMGLCGF
jgi:hypothetical protein